MGTKTTQPKFRRKKSTKIRVIIDTFFDLIKERGYSAVSTNIVAEKARISIGTIYRYFPKGKSAILKERYSPFSEDFSKPQELLKMVLDNDAHSIESYIQKYLKMHQDDYQMHKAYDQAILENQDIFNSLQGKIRQQVHSFFYQMKEIEPRIKQLNQIQAEKAILLNLNLLESVIHYHVFHTSLFENDEDLVVYLVRLFQLTNMFYFKLS